MPYQFIHDLLHGHLTLEDEEGLATLARILPFLLGVHDTQDTYREELARFLTYHGLSARFLRALMTLLSHDKAEIRAMAAQALTNHLRTKADPPDLPDWQLWLDADDSVLESLKTLFENSPIAHQENISQTFIHLRRPEDIAYLQNLLKHESDAVFCHALLALDAHAPLTDLIPPSERPALVDRMQRAFGAISGVAVFYRHHAAAYQAFVALYPFEETLPALIALLDAGDIEIRRGAASLIGQLGIQGQPAIPALLALLRRPNLAPYMCADVIWTLGNIKATEAIPAILEALPDADYNTRRVIEKTLPKLGVNPDEAQAR